jgi:hypothetical protein
MTWEHGHGWGTADRFFRFGLVLAGAGDRPVRAAARRASSIESGYSDSFSRFELVLSSVSLRGRLSFAFMRQSRKVDTP